MNRPLAALAAAAMLAASVPTLGFAEESSSSSSSSSASSESSASVTDSSSSSASPESTSSSSSSSGMEKKGPAWMKPCNDLTGLKKAQCIVKHNPSKGKKKDRVQRMNDDKVLNRSAKCGQEEGSSKVQCLRKHGVKTMIQKAVKKEIKRTLRGKKIEASSSSSN